MNRFMCTKYSISKTDITDLSYQRLLSQREVEKVCILFAGRRRISINHYTLYCFRTGQKMDIVIVCLITLKGQLISSNRTITYANV